MEALAGSGQVLCVDPPDVPAPTGLSPLTGGGDAGRLPSRWNRARWEAWQRDVALYVLWERMIPPGHRDGRAGWPPTIVLVHDRQPDPRLVEDCDALICLHAEAAERLGSRHRLVVHAPWGPDLGFPGYEVEEPAEFRIACTGRTGRDYRTLARALQMTAVPAAIGLPSSTGFPPTTRTLRHIAGVSDRFDPDSYERPIVAFGWSSVVVIPLQEPFRTPVGLTEFNDAMALGRPVIMTRTPGLGVDIEREGLGLWVDPGDHVGLAEAILKLRRADLRAELSRRVRAFAVSRWNYGLFVDALQAVRRSLGHAGA